MSALGSMGIRFVSKAEIEAVQQKADEARAASQKAAAAQRKVEGEAKRQRVASGDASWVAPAEEEAAAAREGQPAAPPAEAPKSRDAAGLGFMNAAPAGFGAALARIARELNPYADAAKDSSQWTRDGAVCLERFGSLESLPEMRRIQQELQRGGGGGGAGSHAHLQATARDARRLVVVSGNFLTSFLEKQQEKERLASLPLPGREAREERVREEETRAEEKAAERRGPSQVEVDANKLAAKALRAKMRGDTAEYERLQAQADAAAAAAPPAPPPAAAPSGGGGAGGERIVLLRGEEDAVDRAQALALIEERLSEAAEREARGGKGRGGKKLKRRRPDRARPAAVEMEALSTRRPKRVQRFDKGSGERTKYFRDDDAGASLSSASEGGAARSASLSSLYEEARRGAGKTIDDHYADNVARAGRKYKGPASADDEHESRLSRKSDAKRKQAEASQQAPGRRSRGGGGALEQTAEKRFNERKHLVVALGELDKAPIGLGHCVIEPIEHVFLEQHLRLGSAGLPSRDTMAIELLQKGAEAILECDEEWSQHKKIYDTGGWTVPAGFSYFAVSFALQACRAPPEWWPGHTPEWLPSRDAGYAHVVEDEAEWNTDFGRETVEGLIEFDGAGIPLKRRPPLPFEEMRSRVAFEPYDWTQQLS
ncbi:hypothetical protein EMIHUDRAFT_213262 [Emiliania huxleyi CCMP1516]|uniref:Cwf19-like protein C-terminal domain-containing protein n=2 Tax=Emiliania huxleyi TaxID=2903 RepID=A0A0D3IMU7_EMIH1|nr:hypothetical protein EMIHUDRAFT_213262 [Emiliania huxleyi CCMP1516]EOD12582.1 hypothetical protein EMIHUDRAFT_213262 [Emiliania huxleyi CCMP1516]|eukprot:XP_005765011.1 hypothetical protein EMIHUDRAFT_213262 [Emiliania huxleyi CCMP1516]